LNSTNTLQILRNRIQEDENEQIDSLLKVYNPFNMILDEFQENDFLSIVKH